MKISWVILTYNRVALVNKAITHNLENAGTAFHEMIWVDNGSFDGTFELANSFKPDLLIRNHSNLGVARGYNQGMVMATGDWIVITGCDMLMPDNWLKKFAGYCQQVPNTACASMYSVPIDTVPERFPEGPKLKFISQLPLIEAMPIDRRMFRRDLLKKIGYLREDFGLYAWEDVEWACRLTKHCKENGLITYLIPSQVPHHLQNDEWYKNNPAMKKYQAFKDKLTMSSRSAKLLKKCQDDGYPYYNPFF